MKRILVIVFSCLYLVGCSSYSGNKDYREIEKALFKRYGENFKIIEVDSENLEFKAYPKHNKELIFDGFYFPQTKSVFDNYIYSNMARALTKELNDNLYIDYPDYSIIVSSTLNYQDNKDLIEILKIENQSLDQYFEKINQHIIGNYGLLSSYGSFNAIIVTKRNTEDIDYKEYHKKIEEIFEDKLWKLASFKIMDSFVLADDEYEKFENLKELGVFEIFELREDHRRRDGIDHQRERLIQYNLGFMYKNPAVLSDESEHGLTFNRE